MTALCSVKFYDALRLPLDIKTTKGTKRRKQKKHGLTQKDTNYKYFEIYFHAETAEYINHAENAE